ncbi:MAG: nuclear transport factor 2 family protein [Rhizomicrobium sp.]
MEISDILEIQQLMALYGHAVDAQDQSLFPQVFTEDAVFDARSTGWGLIEGREAIAAWFALGKPPHPPSHHLTNAHVYEADGETRVRSKWLIIDRRTGGVVSGDYHDVVARTDEGWRIKRRSFIIRYPGSYEGQAPSKES